MSPKGSSEGVGGSGLGRVVGSGVAGISELLVFHPVDTVAKRLMTYEGKAFSNMNEAVFQKHANSTIAQKYGSLFPGIGFGAAYKVLQRIYKFGGQPYVNKFMVDNFTPQFSAAFGAAQAKTMIYATAGSIMGVGEIVLLPLDVLKIKAQTNPEAFKGRGVFKIFADEGLNLYKGASWTAARNAPGSFALFGGSAFMKDYVFGLKKYSDATFLQDSAASIVGACASIAVAQPLDVIKTRIQKRDFSDKTGGVKILTDMVKNEGFGAFFKGFVPKLLVVGPKLVFSFTIAQQLISMFDKSN